MITLCTYLDKHYLARGLALHASLMRHHGEGFQLFVLALDDETCDVMRDLPNVQAVRLEYLEVSFPELAAAKANRSLLEYYWTLTPFWMRQVFDLSERSAIAYLDADCFLFHPLDSLYREVSHADVAIIPHRFSKALQKTHGVNGTYNVGWVYFREDGRGDNPCLERWMQQCLEWCYRRAEQNPNGKWRFGDQGYLDDWVALYGAHVVKHLGANLAPWNQMNYEYEWGTSARRDEPKRLFVIDRAPDGEVKRIDPLLFYHFHGMEFRTLRQSPVISRGGYPLASAVEEYVYKPYEYTVQRIAEELGNPHAKRRHHESLAAA